MTILNNPEGWARNGAGSIWRLGLMIILHLILCIVTIFLVLLPFRHVSPMPQSSIASGGGAAMLFFVGVYFSGLYLYAMFRLLKRIDELETGVSAKRELQ
ncbi:MAG: hypothetical protein Q7N50_08215 [Armatimonadota bacterium]|nr:hypothetical protein [Armatimonadota bacterium]